MMNLAEIGQRIKDNRKSIGLTQKQLGEYLGLDQSMVAKIEKGQRNINSDVIDRLSSLFCCPIDYILYGKNNNKKCQIAFRTDKLSASDLKAIAEVNKIILNQFEMDKILGEIYE